MEPIACTLNAAALEDRASMWRTLLADGLLAQESTPDGVRLRLRPSVEQRARELLALEARCCAWFRGELTAGDPVVVDLLSEGDGVTVLHAMLADWSGQS